jgi:hypothetical protein
VAVTGNGVQLGDQPIAAWAPGAILAAGFITVAAVRLVLLS